jgi:hypothetical protein
LPSAFSTKSNPLLKVTLTFFSCLRDVNSGILLICLIQPVIARRNDEAIANKQGGYAKFAVATPPFGGSQ